MTRGGPAKASVLPNPAAPKRIECSTRQFSSVQLSATDSSVVPLAWRSPCKTRPRLLALLLFSYFQYGSDSNPAHWEILRRKYVEGGIIALPLAAAKPLAQRAAPGVRR